MNFYKITKTYIKAKPSKTQPEAHTTTNLESSYNLDEECTLKTQTLNEVIFALVARLFFYFIHVFFFFFFFNHSSYVFRSSPGHVFRIYDVIRTESEGGQIFYVFMLLLFFSEKREKIFLLGSKICRKDELKVVRSMRFRVFASWAIKISNFRLLQKNIPRLISRATELLKSIDIGWFFRN